VPVREERLMVTDRIQIVRDGQTHPAATSKPVLTSSSCPLDGILLEQHSLPRGELPAASFIGHLVTVNTGGSHFREWRADGKSGRSSMPPGGICLCSGQEVWAAWDRPIQFIALSICPDTMQQAAYETANKTVVLRPEPNLADQVVANLARAIHTEIRSGCPAGPLLGESLVTDLAAYLLRQHAVEPINLPYFKGGIPRVRLNRVFDYVEASLATKLRVADLAALTGMSPYYFGKLFKQSTGLTVHEYVTRRRVQHAIDLLKRARVEISGVGAAVGIPDQSQFTRLFRKYAGMSPGRYQGRSAGRISLDLHKTR
jgi:AraC family transcriptional regulator